jgi:hypothetical protein
MKSGIPDHLSPFAEVLSFAEYLPAFAVCHDSSIQGPSPKYQNKGKQYLFQFRFYMHLQFMQNFHLL